MARLPLNSSGSDTRRPRSRFAKLYSLDAFRLSGYRKVLFCDADLLFRQPVYELFDADADLLCCGDGTHLRNRRRDADTWADTDAPGAMDRTFNSGFLLIDARLLGSGTHADLLSLVSPATSGRGTDQLVLNRYFRGRQTLVSWTYNYLLAHAGAIERREALPWGRAKVLHFVGPAKPWEPHRLLRRMAAGARPGILPAAKLWYGAWLDHLAGAHLGLGAAALVSAQDSAARVGP